LRTAMLRYASYGMLIAVIASAVVFVRYPENEKAQSLLLSVASGYIGALNASQNEENSK